jgi:hypothetical protein
MLVVLCVGYALLILAVIYRRIRIFRQRRSAARDPLQQVFQPREFRELEAHLNDVAEEELRRMDANVVQYLAGEAGHVVVISDRRHEIELLLSDGRRMALGGVSGVARRSLVNRAAQDQLRPARVERDGLSYRLLLRGQAGAEIEVHTRRLALRP